MSPTATNRDLVLSDEDLAEIAERVDRFRDVAFSEEQQIVDDFDVLFAAIDKSRTVLRQVRAAIEGRTSVNVSVILSALGERVEVEEGSDTAPHRRSFDICARCYTEWPCPTVSALGEQE